jgi:hypothetical protein
MVTVIVVILALFAALLIYAVSRPNNFRIHRTASIAAPAGKIYLLIVDFHAWSAWSPYERLDPNMRKTYEGPTSGKGAIYKWDGDSKAGAGRMEITEASEPRQVTIRLDFSKPFVAHNIAEFTLEPAGAATTVTWAMSGRNPFMMKLMGVFISMDKMIGKDFEAGLANLKAATE